MKVLVTGANGQLGQCLQELAPQFQNLEFTFCSSHELDITQQSQIEDKFSELRPDFCINAAAYTAVDKAESESDRAFLINETAVGYLALACKKYNTSLIHVSTDFVFDGTKNTPYQETDAVNPLGVYGQSKLAGEQRIQEILESFYIVRTSWVYSDYGHNFKKTMLRLGKERGAVSVVNDQRGCPTHAIDLAQALLAIVNAKNHKAVPYGIYHFCGNNEMTWYSFAIQIFEEAELKVAVTPIPTSDFPTPAKRPAYSVLDRSKWDQTF
ncbi:dTDP-4-dehydrorhamnose reductase [Flavobacterium aurantiibacter]|uniref:dTDP-4-dehydrorhamnose reductase n=1 Tax=Flavobacterium aurantiibacter TaxID=2023067 RepID=A0A255ZLN0_9FLAO|nr:dTDP-4-dehydrorhamnose reductase [Flavobacterium aurantiibacter]OYQ41550.1 dTDP-4-dehydrorhamnose reductase [Flavobacterium aurantiibacter]